MKEKYFKYENGFKGGVSKSLSLITLVLMGFGSFSQVETKIIHSNPLEFGYFGLECELQGTRVIVGSSQSNATGGVAQIYDLIGGSWMETVLSASDGVNGNGFGRSVSLDGDRVAVSSSNHNVGGVDVGAVYVYDLVGGSWIETKIVASDGAAGDRFGYRSGLDGDRIVVGARDDDDNGSNSGSIYVYDLVGGSWVETKIVASDGATNDEFGEIVEVEGDRIVVGVRHDDDNGFDSGSIYVYDLVGGSWVETKIVASDGAANDRFGEDVNVEGDRIVVGAYQDDDNGSNSGSIYVYDLVGGSWVETKIVASDGAAGDEFGFSAALDGDNMVVGAIGDDDNGSNSGSVYLYRLVGGSWVETKIVASDGLLGDGLGQSVSYSDGRIGSGAPGFDGIGQNSGAFYIFNLCAAGDVPPSLSASSITNICPSVEVDLNSLHSGTIPTGTVLVWSTDNVSSDGLDMTGHPEDADGNGSIDDPTTVSEAGTYYAYYYDSVEDCYSPVSAAVNFTFTECCNPSAPVLSY